jgi:Mrp family chromosome partitioning ATPase
LQIITCGPLPPNPADLLGSERMQALIEALKNRADVVLFDTPPVLAVTDAVMLSTRVDGVLLVNDAGRTRRAAAERAVERLRQVDANLIGVVLNRLSAQGSGYYAHQYYYEETQNGRRPKRRRGWKKFPGWLLDRFRPSGNHRQAVGNPQPAGEPASEAEQS